MFLYINNFIWEGAIRGIELIDYCLLDNKSLGTPDTGLWENGVKDVSRLRLFILIFLALQIGISSLGLRTRCFASDFFFISPSNLRKIVELLDLSFLVIS